MACSQPPSRICAQAHDGDDVPRIAVFGLVRRELILSWLHVSVGRVYLSELAVAQPVDDVGCNAARGDH
jgi:hypothetical protein